MPTKTKTAVRPKDAPPRAATPTPPTPRPPKVKVRPAPAAPLTLATVLPPSKCALCGETAEARGQTSLAECGTWLTTLPTPAPFPGELAHLLCVAEFAEAKTRAALAAHTTTKRRAPKAPTTPTGPSLPAVLGHEPSGRVLTVRVSVLMVTALNLLHPDTFGGALTVTPHMAYNVGTIRAYSLTAQESVLHEVMDAARNRGDGSMRWGQPTQWGRACRDAARQIHAVLHAPAASSFAF